jgi:hypothetical protein
MEEDHKEVYRLKYYDGMGKDVTDYVLKLEQRVAELEAKSTLITEVASEPVDVGIMEEEPKPKKRKVTKLADTE